MIRFPQSLICQIYSSLYFGKRKLIWKLWKVWNSCFSSSTFWPKNMPCFSDTTCPIKHYFITENPCYGIIIFVRFLWTVLYFQTASSQTYPFWKYSLTMHAQTTLLQFCDDLIISRCVCGTQTSGLSDF